MNKKGLNFILCCFVINVFFAWGPTGHRVVGEVAYQNLDKSTKRKIEKLLNYKSLATVSTFGDEIKSDKRYNKFYVWHFVNFEFGKKYHECEKNKEGDLIQGIDSCISIIKSEKSNKKDKIFYLKMLVHFIGDLHQPLHTGRGEDKGGNDIKVKWFNSPSNLHRIWDDDMIEHYDMSYTELTNDLDFLSKLEKMKIQQGTILDWVYESQTIAQNVYNSAKPEDNLGYKYQYENFAIVKSQLQKAGLRLAKILNDIF